MATLTRVSVPLRDSLEGFEYAAMQHFPWKSHTLRVLTVENPGKKLHELLVEKGFCAAHNAASGFVDIMYLSRAMAAISTAGCKRSPRMPNYVKPMDFCR
jgi:hypothetical protein